MDRRTFLCGLTMGTLSAPLAADAQQAGKMYRIAFVHPSTPVADLTEEKGPRFYKALFSELRRLGYAEERNLVVERRLVRRAYGALRRSRPRGGPAQARGRPAG